MQYNQLIYLWLVVVISVDIEAKCHCKSSNGKFPDSTAFLFLDYEVGILARFPNSTTKTNFLSQSMDWLQAVRDSDHSSAQIMFSNIEFRPGYPEISCYNKQFSPIPNLNSFISGMPDTAFYPGIEPQEREIILKKSRVSAVYNSELLTLLESQCIKTVVLAGLSTSGVILSTTRQLADMDFVIFIIRDAVMDSNPTVNDVLLDSVLSSQATILTVDVAKEMLKKKDN